MGGTVYSQQTTSNQPKELGANLTGRMGENHSQAVCKTGRNLPQQT